MAVRSEYGRTVTAFVFPGQGPQSIEMLSPFQPASFFQSNIRLVEDTLGNSLQSLARREGPQLFLRNDVASIMTVFASAVALNELHRKGIQPGCVAGYSVGQWTAMYAAGMLSFRDLLTIVKVRADEMVATQASADGAMMAVIGLQDSVVKDVCKSISTQEEPVAISNFNCTGQVTIAGTRQSVKLAADELARRKPHKLVPVATSGAWHCSLLEGAKAPLARLLEQVTFQAPSIPVADNVTGGLLPEDPKELRQQMVRHLTEPVQWHQCVRTLSQLGVKTFVEVGYGDMLTKFGFFIDRNAQHVECAKLLVETE